MTDTISKGLPLFVRTSLRRDMDTIRPRKLHHIGIAFFVTVYLSACAPQVGIRSSPAGSVFKDCPECPEMVVIPAGSFVMGDLNGGLMREERLYHRPIHQVTIKEPFALGKYEVTQAEWKAVMGTNPSRFKGERNPVEMVSWRDASEFVKRLSAMTGKTYRLPSEAEWEYAARAGSETMYAFGNEVRSICEHANGGDVGSGVSMANRKYRDGYSRTTAPVGQFRPNAFGLWDMHGNVFEWVKDCHNPNYEGAPTDGRTWMTGNCDWRIHRGGGWNGRPSVLRSAFRNAGVGDWVRNVGGGFRVARTLEQSNTGSSH